MSITSTLPEPINQTYFGVLIGGGGIYFLSKSDLVFGLKYPLIFLAIFYTFYMVSLSCIQMCKNTYKYRHKEFFDNDKHFRNIKEFDKKINNLKLQIEIIKLKQNISE
jgi:hypothetical protein